MSFIFDQGIQDGPSAQEILAKRRREAEKKQQGIRESIIRDKSKGVNAQLLGNRNPSFKLPGQGS